MATTYTTVKFNRAAWDAEFGQRTNEIDDRQRSGSSAQKQAILDDAPDDGRAPHDVAVNHPALVKYCKIRESVKLS